MTDTRVQEAYADRAAEYTALVTKTMESEVAQLQKLKEIIEAGQAPEPAAGAHGLPAG